ncbi:MAG: hypothetical protein KC635_23045 [Myxococcales bacterium]|nr:hypothetical protein [Myxococcales bacterium]
MGPDQANRRSARLRATLAAVLLVVVTLGVAVVADRRPSPAPDDPAATPADTPADEEPPAAEPEVRAPHDADVPPDLDAPKDGDVVILGVPLSFSGNFWTDVGFMKRLNERQGQYDQDATYMQGRFVLAAEHTSGLGDTYYATARVELLGFVNEFTKSQFEAHVQDAYVIAGSRLWDVQVGRFLAWEVYHRGQGIELYTAEEAGALEGPSLYWLQVTRGHRNEAGQLAFHLFPTDWLAFELAGVYGQESNQNNLGVRPVVALDFGRLDVKLGYEYLAQLPQTDADKVEVKTQGFAAMVSYAFPHLTLGADVGHASVDYTDIQGLTDGEKTFDKTSVGGFADIDFADSSIGLGYHFTMQENEQGEQNTHHQAFVTFLQHLPIPGLSVKLVYGFATAHIQDIDVGSEWDNTMHSVRLRVAYDFQ